MGTACSTILPQHLVGLTGDVLLVGVLWRELVCGAQVLGAQVWLKLFQKDKYESYFVFFGEVF
jgi:hypothetical protein